MAPATRDHAETLLLKAARAYGLDASCHDIQRAVDDPAFAEWASTHLIPDCLLSVDELASYADLDRSGQVDRLAALHDLAEVQAVDDQDLRLAVQELQQSTQRISQQTRTLRQQQDALAQLIGKDSDKEARRRRMADARQRKADADRRRLFIEVEELSRDVGFKLSDLDLQCRDALPKTDKLVSDMFKSDDKLLASLERLGRELHPPDVEEQQRMHRLEDICTRLVNATVEAARIKLNTVYLDSLVAVERSGNAKHATLEEVKALEEEVDSLYSEMVPVTQMSVEKQHVEPAIKAVAAKNGDSLGRTTEALAYINDCLDYLLSRMDGLRNHISHLAASEAIASVARHEMAQTASTGEPTASSPAFASPRRSSPVRIKAATGAHGGRRWSSIQEQPPIEMLMQNLGLATRFLSTEPGKKQVEFLADELADRSKKAAEVTRGAQDSFETSTASQLQDAKLAIQLVRDVVLAESPFGEVKLLDPELEESILVLHQEMGKARDRLGAMSRMNISAKSEKREEMMRRF